MTEPHTGAEPRTGFDWAIYADATFAGLAILIPIPFVDSWFEFWFRTRIPRAIAKRRGFTLEPAAVYNINRQDGNCLTACLLLPITVTFELIKRLSKKALYFLTVKEATDMVSYYWHFAFLVDYAMLAGHLDDGKSARMTRQSIDQVLGEPKALAAKTSPLMQVASQVTSGTRHIFRTLRNARRGDEDDVIEERRSMMGQAWDNFAGYFEGLADQYDMVYYKLEAEAERQAAKAQAELGDDLID